MNLLCGILLAFTVWFSRPDPQLNSRLKLVKHWIDIDSLSIAHAVMQEIDLTRATNYQQAQWHFRKAYLNVYLHSRYLQGLKDYKRAYYYLQQADTTDLQMAFDLLNNQGEIYWSYHDYNGALAVYNQAMEVCDQRNASDALKTDLAILYYNIGITYRQKNELGEAIRFFRKSYEIDEYPRTLNLIGLCYRDNKEYHTAIDYFNKYLNLSYDSLSKGYAYHNLANTVLNIKDSLLAIEYFQQALSYKIQTKKKFVSYLDLGMLYHDLGRESKALEILFQAKQALPLVALKPEHFKVLDLISQIYLSQQQWDSAYHYQALYAQYYEQFDSDKNEIRQLDRKFQLTRIENEVQNEFLIQEHNQRNRMIIIRFFGLLLVGTIVLLTGRWYHRRTKRDVQRTIQGIEDQFRKDFGS